MSSVSVPVKESESVKVILSVRLQVRMPDSEVEIDRLKLRVEESELEGVADTVRRVLDREKLTVELDVTVGSTDGDRVNDCSERLVVIERGLDGVRVAAVVLSEKVMDAEVVTDRDASCGVVLKVSV